MFVCILLSLMGLSVPYCLSQVCLYLTVSHRSVPYCLSQVCLYLTVSHKCPFYFFSRSVPYEERYVLHSLLQVCMILSVISVHLIVFHWSVPYDRQVFTSLIGCLSQVQIVLSPNQNGQRRELNQELISRKQVQPANCWHNNIHLFYHSQQ